MGSGTFNSSHEYKGEVQLNDREGEEGVFYQWRMGNGFTYAFKANHSYHLTYLESPPHELNRWTTEYLHKGHGHRLFLSDVSLFFDHFSKNMRSP